MSCRSATPMVRRPGASQAGRAQVAEEAPVPTQGEGWASRRFHSCIPVAYQLHTQMHTQLHTPVCRDFPVAYSIPPTAF